MEPASSNGSRIRVGLGRVKIYHVNRYNWLAHKLFTYNQYDEVVAMKEYLNLRKSEHLLYLNCLVQLRRSQSLEQVISVILNELNYNKQEQYFKLLCQCLLYMGQHESVALLINDLLQNLQRKAGHSEPIEGMAAELLGVGGGLYQAPTKCHHHHHHQQHQEEPPGGDRSVQGDNDTPLIQITQTDYSKDHQQQQQQPQQQQQQHQLEMPLELWYIFAQCLYYGHQHEAALAIWKRVTQMSHQSAQLITSNHLLLSFLRVAHYSIKMNDLKGALYLLRRARELYPDHVELNSTLALVLSQQQSSSTLNHIKSLHILNHLESRIRTKANHHNNGNNNNNNTITNTTANNSNNNSRKLRDHQGQPPPQQQQQAPTSQALSWDRSAWDPMSSLEVVLIRGHIQLQATMAMANISQAGDHRDDQVKQEIGKLIAAYRRTTNGCWQSASFWNNLAVLFMVMEKYVATYSCLMKAFMLRSYDWRINFNLGLVLLKLGLSSRSLLNFRLAQRANMSLESASTTTVSTSSHLLWDGAYRTGDPLLASMLGLCYDRLDEPNQARNYHIRATGATSKDPSTRALINYAIFLLSRHNIIRNSNNSNNNNNNNTHYELVYQLLLKFEQSWLKRNQNSLDFDEDMMNQATLLAQSMPDSCTQMKQFAWMRHLSTESGPSPSSPQEELAPPPPQ